MPYYSPLGKLIYWGGYLIKVISSAFTPSNTYYVSNTGNDASAGTSENTAWQTLSKVNATSFNPGDQILLKKGDTWRETLTVPSSGTSNSYITFGSYGTGNIPKILGSTYLTVWNNNSIGGVAANNDIFHESFEGTGYENTWTELIGANTGCIVNEDSSDLTPPTGGGSQTLKMVKVITPTATATASRAAAYTTLNSEKPITYLDFYVNIAAHGLSAGDELNIYSGNDAGWSGAAFLNLYNMAGTLKFHAFVYNNGNWSSSGYSVALSLNQWYHIQFIYDATNKLYSCMLDGAAIITGSLAGAYRTGIKILEFGDESNVKTATTYFDSINISSTNFYELSTSLPTK